jgi:hypothetical protein
MDAPEWMQHTDDTVLAVWTDIEAAIKQQWWDHNEKENDVLCSGNSGGYMKIVSRSVGEVTQLNHQVPHHVTAEINEAIKP